MSVAENEGKTLYVCLIEFGFNRSASVSFSHIVLQVLSTLTTFHNILSPDLSRLISRASLTLYDYISLCQTSILLSNQSHSVSLVV